jgi:hypothetical protein
MLKMLQRLRRLLLITFLFIFTGCATVPPVVPPRPPTATSAGIYHRVQKGQTLWRIAKMYNVDLQELVNVNHMQDSSRIEMNQYILIPNPTGIGLPKPYKEGPNRVKETTLSIDSSAEDFIWPLKGKVIANFGQNFNNAINKGINIQPYKQLEVVASRSGKVVFFDDDFLDFGKTIIIEHPDGFWTVYGRNEEVFVKIGDIVKRGNGIAKVGSAGRDRNTYLHFEIRKGPISQNPNFYLP